MSHRPASSPAPPVGRSIPRARRMITVCGGMAVFPAAASVLAPAASATVTGGPGRRPQDRRHEPGGSIANVGGDVADVRQSPATPPRRPPCASTL
jgi:hypothetical protein